jgi:transcriptional regulator with XRE-family HTH domain
MPKRKTEVIEHFGERLAELRKAAGYTQVEFAAELAITQRMVDHRYVHRARQTQAARQLTGGIMTTVQIQLPDDLAQDAQAAGLLTPEAMATMLREQLRKQAGESLRAMWERMPPEELTPEVEQMIDDEVRAARAERRKRNAS